MAALTSNSAPAVAFSAALMCGNSWAASIGNRDFTDLATRLSVPEHAARMTAVKASTQAHSLPWCP